jgi:hypothetical protein
MAQSACYKAVTNSVIRVESIALLLSHRADVSAISLRSAGREYDAAGRNFKARS